MSHLLVPASRYVWTLRRGSQARCCLKLKSLQPKYLDQVDVNYNQSHFRQKHRGKEIMKMKHNTSSCVAHIFQHNGWTDTLLPNKADEQRGLTTKALLLYRRSIFMYTCSWNMKGCPSALCEELKPLQSLSTSQQCDDNSTNAHVCRQPSLYRCLLAAHHFLLTTSQLWSHEKTTNHISALVTWENN